MDTKKQEEFVMLFSRHQPDLRRYIYSLCGNLGDTDDILQNCSIALWRKFEQYDSSMPFKNWAFRFAYFEVMKFHDQSKKMKVLQDETRELLNLEFAEEEDKRNAQRHFLGACIAQLDEKDQKLIKLRYEEKMTVKRINEMYSETGKKIYRSLERIRSKLLLCVNYKLLESGW